MSEVKRYSEGPVGKGIYSDPNGELCGFHHLERVTAERDAALAAEQFVIAENKALQQRLEATREREDALGSLVPEAEQALKALNVAVSVFDIELADRARRGLRLIISALKPANGGGDEA